MSAGVTNAATCKPEDYGALHDGTHDDTSAVQKAIDACRDGGTIVLGSGTYLSGPLTLGSEQTFEVDKGATLLGIADHERYRDAGGRTVVPLLSAKDAHDIVLTGEGTIDGQGVGWWPAFRAAKAEGHEQDYPRPKMIVFYQRDKSEGHQAYLAEFADVPSGAFAIFKRRGRRLDNSRPGRLSKYRRDRSFRPQYAVSESEHRRG